MSKISQFTIYQELIEHWVFYVVTVLVMLIQVLPYGINLFYIFRTQACLEGAKRDLRPEIMQHG